jgi:hypothetical protein
MSICQHSDRTVWLPFLQSLAPPIIQHLLNVHKTGLATELHFVVLLDGIRMVEQLVLLAEDATSMLRQTRLVICISRLAHTLYVKK